MQYFFPDATIKELAEIAKNINESVPKRIAAMKLIREFNGEHQQTFGLGAKVS
jgi:hypothetical protein